MSKWVSYGYGPQSDPESIRARLEEDGLLREYLPLILSNADLILGTPRYFFCQLWTAYMSSLWVFRGGGPIPLGVLIGLWGEGKLLYDCPSCGLRLHVTGLRGSALQKFGAVWGYCAGCGWQKVSPAPCHDDMMAIGSMLRFHRNEPVIEKGKQPRFDWKEGLVGEYTPDRVIVPAVEPSDLRSLIVDLSGSKLDRVSEDGQVSPDSGSEKRLARPMRRGFAYPIPLAKKSD
ncbi:MAG: hypothetical protein WAU32_04275 [Thermoanaerobaculia bacterium]